MMPPEPTARAMPAIGVGGLLVACWGVLGFLALLGSALWRLAPVALEPLSAGMLAWWQGGLYLAWVVFMVYSEGYRGFHLQVAPRVTARALYLARNPRPLWALLAPMFCMGLIHATRRRLVTSWIVLVAIVTLVIAVRQLPQPWRGMVDGGVVLGLAVGAASIVLFFARGLQLGASEASPEVPDERDPVAPR
jgi:hypothetical protein